MANTSDSKVFLQKRIYDIVQFLFFLIPLLLLQSGCSQIEYTTTSASAIPAVEPVWYDFSIVNTYPHDPEAFTQGLLFRDGYLYESTGRRGYSTLRKVELESGRVFQLHKLDSNYFGEGLTDMDDRFIQLTLSAGTGFVYDIESFSLIETFSYEGDGWGLANDGDRLIISDGTTELRFLDPETFQETGRLTVWENGEPLRNLNEMVMVDDRLFANVLHTNHIVIVNPLTGVVEGRVDLDKLADIVRNKGDAVNVMNGLAYDRENDRLFVTGKLWPKLFEIRIIPRE